MNLAEHARQLAEQKKEVPQMLLVFGEAFTGKTSLVCQLAKKYKLIWIDTDNGYDVIFEALESKYWENITLIRLRDTDLKAVAAETVWKLLRSTGDVKVSAETGIINCPATAKAGGQFITLNFSTLTTDTVIVVDSLTKLSDSAMQNYLGGPVNMDFKKKEFSHYDKQGLYLRNIFNACQRLNCHSTFITHEEEIEQEDGTKKLTPVCGTRNFSTQIGRYFSHCIHTSIKNKKHVVNSNTVGELRAIAGSRANVDIKTEADFLKIFERDFSKIPKGIQITSEAEVPSKLEEVAQKLSGELDGDTPPSKPLTLAEKLAAKKAAEQEAQK